MEALIYEGINNIRKKSQKPSTELIFNYLKKKDNDIDISIFKEAFDYS